MECTITQVEHNVNTFREPFFLLSNISEGHFCFVIFALSFEIFDMIHFYGPQNITAPLGPKEWPCGLLVGLYATRSVLGPQKRNLWITSNLRLAYTSPHNLPVAPDFNLNIFEHRPV